MPSFVSLSRQHLYLYHLHDCTRRAKAERESRRKAMRERAKKGLLTEEEKAILATEESEEGKKGDCIIA